MSDIPIEGPPPKPKPQWKRQCGRCKRNIGKSEIAYGRDKFGEVCESCLNELDAQEAQPKGKKKRGRR